MLHLSETFQSCSASLFRKRQDETMRSLKFLMRTARGTH